MTWQRVGMYCVPSYLSAKSMYGQPLVPKMSILRITAQSHTNCRAKIPFKMLWTDEFMTMTDNCVCFKIWGWEEQRRGEKNPERTDFNSFTLYTYNGILLYFPEKPSRHQKSTNFAHWGSTKLHLLIEQNSATSQNNHLLPYPRTLFDASNCKPAQR